MSRASLRTSGSFFQGGMGDVSVVIRHVLTLFWYGTCLKTHIVVIVVVAIVVGNYRYRRRRRIVIVLVTVAINVVK